MENGDAIAKKISDKHPEYSEVDTQALYDRKMAERHDRGIGYPSCSAFEANGSTKCQGCPFQSKGKSPLSIRPPVTATVTPAAGPSPAAIALDLPPGFDLNAEGIICKIVEAQKAGDESSDPLQVPLFMAQLSGFYLSKDASTEKLEFIATAGKGH